MLLLSYALGLTPVLRTAIQPRSSAGPPTEATLQNIIGHRAHSWTVCTSNSTDTAEELHTEGAREVVGTVDRKYTYTNPLWPNGLDWMMLPPGTHLLLYGRSSIAGVSSALRAGSEAYGVLEETVTVSAARDCADPTEDPRKHQQATTCLYDCDAYMTLGPREFNISTTVDPHSITVDYLRGNSSITTISNHAQTQRLESRLDDWLKMVAPLNGTRNFTHSIFMDPRPQWWFDQRCVGLFGEPRHMLNEWNLTVEDCQPSADADCPRRHPLFRTVSRWVDRAPAVMLLPPRLISRDIPFVRGDSSARGTASISSVASEIIDFDPTAEPPPASAYDPAPPEAGENYLPDWVTADDYYVPDEFALRCVLDEQLGDCPQGRNQTVWLAQTKLVYEWAGAAQDLSPPCYCEHVCNARCVSGAASSNEPSAHKCYAGPGIAATWLVLRAAGLA